MARSISEQEQQLKKRARRRLVGAIVLVTAVAVVLPMVLDSEPKPVRQNVDIHIPSPEAGEYKTKPSAAAQRTPAPIKGLPEGTVETAPAEPAAAAPPTVPPAQPSAATVPGAPAGQSSAAAPTQPPLKSDAAASRLAGASDRAVAPPPKDRVERTPPKDRVEPSPPKDRVERAPPKDRIEPSPAKDRAEIAQAPKPAAKAEAPVAKTENARSTSATSKSADAEADSGNYVVQVAALSDAAKAKQLQKQMSGAGLKTYTEVVSTRTGEITRVRAGPYATREAAEKARVQLKKAGLDGQVVVK